MTYGHTYHLLPDNNIPTQIDFNMPMQFKHGPPCININCAIMFIWICFLILLTYMSMQMFMQMFLFGA
jgi:hypothetical protein